MSAFRLLSVAVLLLLSLVNSIHSQENVQKDSKAAEENEIGDLKPDYSKINSIPKTKPSQGTNSSDDITSIMAKKPWELFKVAFNKKFASLEEEEQHRRNFEQSLNLINSANASGGSIRLRLYRFADWYANDRINFLTGYSMPERLMKKFDSLGKDSREDIECVGDKAAKYEAKRVEKLFKKRNVKGKKNLPSSFDWREEGKNRVGPVKDQLDCHIDWAIAATGVLEGQKYRYHNNSMDPISLSEQNIIDCAPRKLNIKCYSRGSAYEAFGIIQKTGGIMSSEDYAYDEKPSKYANRRCRFEKKRALIKKVDKAICSVSHDLAKRNDLIKMLLIEYGPVATAMEARDDKLFFYSKGIYKNDNCGKSIRKDNHEILIVGYGHDKEANLDYWIAKNSWGQDWGERGYFKVAFGTCDIGSIFTLAKIHAK